MKAVLIWLPNSVVAVIVLFGIVLVGVWFIELRRRPREEALHYLLALLLLFLITVAIVLVWGAFNRPTTFGSPAISGEMLR